MSRINETPQRSGFLSPTYVPRSKERLRQLLAERQGPSVSRRDFLRAPINTDAYRHSQFELPLAPVRKLNQLV